MANVETTVAAAPVTEDVEVAQPEEAVVVESAESEVKMETASCETRPEVGSDKETKVTEAASDIASDSTDGNKVSSELEAAPEQGDKEIAPNNTPVKPAAEAVESEPLSEEDSGKAADDVKTDSTEEADVKKPEVVVGESIECEEKTADKQLSDITASVEEEPVIVASTEAA